MLWFAFHNGSLYRDHDLGRGLSLYPILLSNQSYWCYSSGQYPFGENRHQMQKTKKSGVHCDEVEQNSYSNGSIRCSSCQPKWNTNLPTAQIQIVRPGPVSIPAIISNVRRNLADAFYPSDSRTNRRAKLTYHTYLLSAVHFFFGICWRVLAIFHWFNELYSTQVYSLVLVING